MDRVECDSSSISLWTCLDDVSSQYAATYLKSFLPVYQMVHQSESISSVAGRYEAIKFAADASLALTASGASWSDALSKKLTEDCGERGSISGDLLCEDRLSRSLMSGVTSGSSAFQHQLTPVVDGTNFFLEPRVLVQNSYGKLLGGNSLEYRNTSRGKRNSALRLRLYGRSLGRNRCRSQLVARNANRLAVLRNVSLRNKSRRRFLRTSRKPKTALRKAKSLAQFRSRASSQRPRQVDSLELDPKFDSGIVALQRLVPGGADMDAALLLDETADFLMFLKCQVQALQSIANAVDAQECFGDIVPES